MIMEMISKKKLYEAMLAKGYNERQLAKATKINPFTISQMLQKDSCIRLSSLARLTNALGCRAEELIINV